MRLFVALAVAIALLAVIFAVQNNIIIGLSFFGWEFQAPMPVFLLTTLAVGVAIGLLVSIPAIVRRGWSAARQTRQVEHLNQQLAEKEQDMTAQSQSHRRTIKAAQSTTEELLRALAIADPQTGLIQLDWLHKSILYLLEQMSTTAEIPAIALFMLEGEVESAVDRTVLQKAIAQRLREPLSTNSWIFTDGSGRFAWLTMDAEGKAANELGDRIRDQLVQTPIVTTPEPQHLSVSIGGAIALRDDNVDSKTVMQQAEEALELAQKRGRNRVRLVNATRPKA
jgi:uncharacterized integral membrane protein